MKTFSEDLSNKLNLIIRFANKDQLPVIGKEI